MDRLSKLELYSQMLNKTTLLHKGGFQLPRTGDTIADVLHGHQDVC
jgi:hypothetical protein